MRGCRHTTATLPRWKAVVWDGVLGSVQMHWPPNALRPDTDSHFSRRNDPRSIIPAIQMAGPMVPKCSGGEVRTGEYCSLLHCSRPMLTASCDHLEQPHSGSLRPPQGQSNQALWSHPQCTIQYNMRTKWNDWAVSSEDAHYTMQANYSQFLLLFPIPPRMSFLL